MIYPPERASSLDGFLGQGFEIKTAYASKGMHYIILQKESRIVLASTESINVEYGADAYYENYEVREMTRKPA